ncbi:MULTISPECIES: hypothetical protein [unclassified Chromobacterium]|uniref:hypothetical protein n=1 Tax=unclassified Chromobacterium TaxID=2641838 RepID=UPI000B2508A3|nr:hypothetical protein [Chromobacterium sp. LK1]
MQCRHALLLSLAALSASLAAAPLPSYDFAVKDPWETRSKPSMKAKDKTDKALKYKGAVQLKNLDAGPDFSVKAEIRSPSLLERTQKERMQHCIGANPPPGCPGFKPLPHCFGQNNCAQHAPPPAYPLSGPTRQQAGDYSLHGSWLPR